MEDMNQVYDPEIPGTDRKDFVSITVTFTAEDGKILERLQEEKDPKAFLIRLIKRELETGPNSWMN